MKKIVRVLSILLSVILIAGVMFSLPVTVSAATYRDNLINAILNNQSVWKPEYYNYWNGALVFEDLNFDGYPEFIVRDYGGTMHNISNRVFYYSGGKLVEATAGMSSKATVGYPGIISLYYNKTTGAMKYLGVWGARNGITDTAIGNYAFSFNGRKVAVKYYSGTVVSRNMQGKLQSEIFYNGAKNYSDFSGASRISKATYNKINNSYKNGFKEVTVKTEVINSSDWRNYGFSSKRSALEHSYDAYSNSIAKLATPQVSAFQNTAAGVRLTWNAVPGAQKYRVYGYTRNGWRNVGDTTTNSYVYKTKNSGAKYRFTVRCIDSTGKNTLSTFNRNGFSYTFIGVPKLTAVAAVSSGITVKWSKPTGAVAYKVFRKTAGGSWKALGNTTALSFTDKTASKGVSYRYTVRCITKDGKKYVSAYDTTGIAARR